MNFKVGDRVGPAEGGWETGTVRSIRPNGMLEVEWDVDPGDFTDSPWMAKELTFAYNGVDLMLRVLDEE